MAAASRTRARRAGLTVQVAVSSLWRECGLRARRIAHPLDRAAALRRARDDEIQVRPVAGVSTPPRQSALAARRRRRDAAVSRRRRRRRLLATGVLLLVLAPAVYSYTTTMLE